MVGKDRLHIHHSYVFLGCCHDVDETVYVCINNADTRIIHLTTLPNFRLYMLYTPFFSQPFSCIR